MITVGAPTTIEPPWVVVSPMRAAGRLPIITFAEPIAMASGGPVHTHMSPTTAAGMPLISTVGTPGPVIGPPTCGIGGVPGVAMGQTCMSPTRAAGGIGAIVPASDDGCNRAAVDGPVGARYVGRALRAQEDDDARDLLRGREAPQRGLLGLDLDRLLAREPARRGGLVGEAALVHPQRRGDGAGRDGVDEHALRAVGVGEDARERGLRRLRDGL